MIFDLHRQARLNPAAPATDRGAEPKKLTPKQAQKHAMDAIPGELTLRGEAPKPSPVWYPSADGLRLSYLVLIPTREPVHDWRVIVDAYTGEALEVKDIVRHFDGQGLVFGGDVELGARRCAGSRGPRFVLPLRRTDTAERQTRQRQLDALVEAHRRKGGYILGDLTKGGREATADEVGRLAGAGPEGRPRGLECCPTCGEWHGRCLDPSPTFVCKVMTVHCGCQNDNRCD